MKTAIFLIFLVGSYVIRAVAQIPPTDANEPKGYLIGPGDEITGKVLGETQFDFVSRVDEDGKIEVPFFDKPVIAMCKSERDLRVEVAKLLSKYLKSPQLSLRVTQRNSRPPVSVYGEVRMQGQPFILTRRVQLLDVLSAAGGPTEKSGGVVQVYHTRPPICADESLMAEWKATSGGGLNVPSKTYSLGSVRQGVDGSNPEIFPGDIIVLPKASPVYVVGEVVRPGEFSIPEDGLPLTQAVAMASGMTRDAKQKAVKVYRRKAGSPQPETLSINFDAIKRGQEKDILLQPFDIIEVGKAPPSLTDIFTSFITGLPNRVPIPIP
ncbi:MAG: SLBB domain-containing protein [Acidobacteriota bacterium]